MPDQTMIETVRSLLAKAESSQFPAEADSFRRGAARLMERHAISEEMLNPQPEPDPEPVVVVTVVRFPVAFFFSGMWAGNATTATNQFLGTMY